MSVLFASWDWLTAVVSGSVAAIAVALLAYAQARKQR